MTRDFAIKVALGAGLSEDESVKLLDRSPLELMERIGVGIS